MQRRSTAHLLLVPAPWLAALALFAGGGCARRVDTAPPVEPPGAAARAPAHVTAPVRPRLHLELPAVEIVARPEAVALGTLNDEELWAYGVAAAGADDHARAALHFERLADAFPDSPRRPSALHRAGLSLLRVRDFPSALGRLLEALEQLGPGPERADARFRAADAHYFLKEYEEAARMLEPLAWEPEIGPVRRAEAAVKRGICLFQAGQHAAAEAILRDQVALLRGDLEAELDGSYLPSQAQFYLAEIYRQHFLAAPVEPSTSTQERLLADLEYKAQMLLSAQGHYLRCIRLGHPEWATASGYRIGELYSSLHDQLVDARLPADLDAEQATVYREELRGKVRVLVTKAIDVYEKTLATAERVGAANPFVSETREQLERMKRLLLEDTAAATPEDGPPRG